jgi:hypothetical protein
MVSNNAESEAFRTRTGEKDNFDERSGGCSEGARRMGERVEYLSLGVSHSDRTRQNPFESLLGITALGGIFSQLMQDLDDQLAEYADIRERASRRIEHCDRKLESIKQRKQQLIDFLAVLQQARESNHQDDSDD